MKQSFLLCLSGMMLLANTGVADNWARFRGPNGQGVSESSKPPIEFGPDKQVLWKTPLPPGHSSPVVWGDFIFLTAFENGKLATIAIGRRDGKILWKKEASAEKIQTVHQFSSPAASTPVTDGKRVYVYFGSLGLIAYDFSGEEIWTMPLPAQENQYGAATSPILQGENVILICDSNAADSHLLAVHGASGKIAWDKDRPLIPGANWSTPILWQGKEGEQIIVAGSRLLTAYDGRTGEDLWWVNGLNSEHITLPVIGNDLLYLASAGVAGGSEQRPPLPKWPEVLQKFDADKDGKLSRNEVTENDAIVLRPDVAEGVPGRNMSYPMLIGFFDVDKDDTLTEQEWAGLNAYTAQNTDTVFALQLGGKGNLTKSGMVWTNKRGVPEMPSPIFYRDRLYLVRNGGMVTCYDGKSGELVFDRERLGVAGHYCASPVAANGHIYVASEAGRISVFKAGDRLDVVAQTNLGERILATPAIVDNKLYIRTEVHLWAFGEN